MGAGSLEFGAVARAPEDADRGRSARAPGKHVMLAVADHDRRVRARAGCSERPGERDLLRLDHVLVLGRVDDGDVRAQAERYDSDGRYRALWVEG